MISWVVALSAARLTTRRGTCGAGRRLASRWFPSSQFGTARVVAGAGPLTIRPLTGADGTPDPGDVEGLTTSACIDVADADAVSLDTITVELGGGGDLVIDAGTTAGPVDVWLPFSMGVVAQTAGVAGGGGDGAATVTVAAMEGPVAVTTVEADIVFTGLKGGAAAAHTTAGNVSASSVQGNVDFSTTSGAIAVGKAQAHTLRLHTTTGAIGARALYAERTTVSTTTGAVTLGSVHGAVDVATTTGPVFVGSAEGALGVRTTTGEINVHLTAPDRPDAGVLTSTTGDITVTVGEDAQRDVAVEVAPGAANVVNDGWNLRAGGGGGTGGDTDDTEAILAVATQGTVRMGAQSWFAASTALTTRLAGVAQ